MNPFKKTSSFQEPSRTNHTQQLSEIKHQRTPLSPSSEHGLEEKKQEKTIIQKSKSIE